MNDKNDAFLFAAPGQPTASLPVAFAEGQWKIASGNVGVKSGCCDGFLGSRWFWLFVVCGFLLVAAAITVPVLYFHDLF